MIARKETPNTIIASNLFLIVFALGIINSFLKHSSHRYPWLILFTVALDVSIFMLVRKGFEWFKWVMLMFTLFGIISMGISIHKYLNQTWLIVGIGILQQVLSVVAVIYMFLSTREETGSVIQNH